MHNYWVWAQNLRFKIIHFGGYTFWESIFLKLLKNHDEKRLKNSTVN